MENKKIELGVFAAENRKRAADFLNKTTNKVKTALDQNDDGELNLKDASIIAETLNASVKGTVAVIKDIDDLQIFFFREIAHRTFANFAFCTSFVHLGNADKLWQQEIRAVQIFCENRLKRF